MDVFEFELDDCGRKSAVGLLWKHCMSNYAWSQDEGMTFPLVYLSQKRTKTYCVDDRTLPRSISSNAMRSKKKDENGVGVFCSLARYLTYMGLAVSSITRYKRFQGDR